MKKKIELFLFLIIICEVSNQEAASNRTTRAILNIDDIHLLDSIVRTIVSGRSASGENSTSLQDKVEGRQFGGGGGYGGGYGHHHHQQHHCYHCPYHYPHHHHCENNQLLYLGLGALLGFFLAMLLASLAPTASSGKRSIDDHFVDHQTLGLYMLDAVQNWPKDLVTGELAPGLKDLFQVYKGTSDKPECAKSISCQVGLLMQMPERSLIRTAMMTMGSLAASAQANDPKNLLDNIMTTIDIYSGGSGQCGKSPDYCRLSNFI